MIQMLEAGKKILKNLCAETVMKIACLPVSTTNYSQSSCTRHSAWQCSNSDNLKNKGVEWSNICNKEPACLPAYSSGVLSALVSFQLRPSCRVGFFECHRLLSYGQWDAVASRALEISTCSGTGVRVFHSTSPGLTTLNSVGLRY